MAIAENSDDASLAGVQGSNTAAGPGIWGSSDHGRGVVGVTVDGAGVWGHTNTGRAVVGAVNDDGTGVWGETKTGRAVVGAVNGGGGTGVWGETTNGVGVVGKDNDGGDGVSGEGRRGVVGRSPTYQGVYGWSNDNAGVVAESMLFHALFGISHGANNAGVFGHNDGGGWAGIFDGRVDVLGDLKVLGDVILANADCAEDFDVVDGASREPGTVMVFTDGSALEPCASPYDRRVAGVVSGAGSFRPAIILDRHHTDTVRTPIALVGKVHCKVDATDHPIAVGDLLTTSPIVGHAMRATDPSRAFGAVIGKALGALTAGVGLIPVLVGLR